MFRVLSDNVDVREKEPPKMIFMGSDDDMVIEHIFPSCLSYIETDIQLENPKTHKKIQVTALWDTGSTNSCVSDVVADLLELKPIDNDDVLTQADGVVSCPIVIGNMKIENMFFEKKRLVSVPLKGGEKPNAIIGMDIIRLGDFSLVRGGIYSTFRFSVKKTCPA